MDVRVPGRHHAARGWARPQPDPTWGCAFSGPKRVRTIMIPGAGGTIDDPSDFQEGVASCAGTGCCG